VSTGKGQHLYFRHPGGKLNNSVRKLRDVDVRADGGYVVAPPSVHPSGQAYEWLVSLDETPIAKLPAWLLKLLKATDRTSSDEVERTISSTLPRSTLRDFDAHIGRLVQAREGERNNTLFSTAAALGKYVRAGHFTREWLEQELSRHARDIGLSPRETVATLQSGINRGMKSAEAIGETLDILDSSPEQLDRPLRLINGVGYCAAWVSIGSADTTAKAVSRELIVLSDDGRIFSEADLPGSAELNELPFGIDLPHEPQAQKVLSPKGVKRFRNGYRPDPRRTFEAVTKAVDTFVSFDGSLADQQSMSEFTACWIIGTYLLDAFDVVGYLWPTGQRNSGKTQFLNTVSSLAYLGRTVTSGSSFASMRDEADYGATIAFDDCENIKNMDSEKRELLLAGNTRGAQVSFKEPVGQSGWRTRYINNFAPRLFSSIGDPDDVVASRTISIPLVTSTDTSKTRRSPSRASDWPCDLQELRDELWLLGLSHLAGMRRYDQAAAELSDLLARNHDIFRMPLGVAFWLEEEHGITRLFERVSVVANSYQSQMYDFRGRDPITLLLQASHGLLLQKGASSAVLKTREILDRMLQIAREENEAEETILNVTQLGMLLRSLRFTKAKSHGSARGWLISDTLVQQAAAARGVILSSTTSESRDLLPPYLPFAQQLDAMDASDAFRTN
jgi:hypothetical protein